MASGIFFYSDAFQEYDMGPSHPMKPIRLRKTYELLREYGAFDQVDTREPDLCPIETLLETHSREFVQAVEYLNSASKFPYSYHRYGFGTGDNPVFPGIFEASLRYTGGSLQAASA